MPRIRKCIFVFVLLQAAVAAQDKDGNVGTPAEQYKAIVQEFGEAPSANWKATTDEERKQAIARIENLPQRLLELVEKNPQDPIALDALTQVVTSEKPFALIGVNTNDNQVKNLKEIMQLENLNWRSFTYQEAINAKWNSSTPAYYVLDSQGVIRYKWIGYPGEKAIDSALENLLKEAESE